MQKKKKKRSQIEVIEIPVQQCKHALCLLFEVELERISLKPDWSDRNTCATMQTCIMFTIWSRIGTHKPNAYILSIKKKHFET